MKYLFKSVNLIMFGIILQAVYFILLIYTMASLSPLIYYAMFMLGIFCVFFIISGRDAAVYRLSWSVAILLFPAVMGVVYLFYNRRKLGRKIESILNKTREKSLSRLDKKARLSPGGTNNERLARSIEKATGMPAVSYTEAEYFPQGEDFLKRFLKELSEAKHYIFIEFFIIEQGVMWDEILKVLVRKVNEGVEVRLMYDGCATLYTLPYGYYKTLRKMGINCIVYNPLRGLLSFRINARNHRKTAVIDGGIAFCGGLNLADNYINKKRTAGHWKDSAVMVKGGAAWNFTLSFIAMWEFTARQSCKNNYQPPAVNNNPAIGSASVWHDLPLDNENVSEQILLDFITRANKYVYIISPYLAPSENLINALSAASKAGTDVRLLMPFIPDKFLIHAVSKSNYLPLLEAGVRIFEYSPGFIHCKNIVADDERAAISTVNLDFRALYMNHECGICFYGENIIADVKRDFTETQKISREITLEAYLKTGVFMRGVRRVCRIFAPLI
jgi:cardiolipin synthase